MKSKLTQARVNFDAMYPITHVSRYCERIKYIDRNNIPKQEISKSKSLQFNQIIQKL